MTLSHTSSKEDSSSRTQLQCSAAEYRPEGEKGEYSLERLSRPALSNGDSPSSLWMPIFSPRNTANLEHPDVGASLAASCLFKDDLKAFLRATGTIAMATKFRDDDTKDAIEMSEDAVSHASMTEDVAYALRNLIRDINHHPAEEGEASEELRSVRSYLFMATQQGLKARLQSPSSARSPIQTPRYRISPTLLEYLAVLRSGGDTGAAISARVISDWLQADVVDGDADRCQRRIERTAWLLDEERKALETDAIWHDWWAV